VVALALSPDRKRSRRERALYQAQESRQTLLEALEEYYARNQGRVRRPSELSPESAGLFRSHDLCHVIFGLDTTLADEAMADVRTLFSCDVGWRRYAKYMTGDPEAKAIFKELGWLRALGITLWVVPRMVKAVIEAGRMRRRWPWEPPEAFEARSLSDLRREHGIRVI
jgi:hypothetical protein